MRLLFIYFFGLVYIGLTPIASIGQWSISHDTTMGIDKIVMHISVEKKFSDLVDVGLYLKGGSLINYQYPEITPENAQKWSLLPQVTEYTFPYGLPDNDFIVGNASTKMNMLGFGSYINFNRALSYRKKDWFFIRFNLEGGYVEDNYRLIRDLSFSNNENLESETVINGTYEFITIGIGTRAGYKRFLDKRKRFSALASLGISYYHPFYYKDMSGIGYSFPTPFFGVEYELSIGFAYLFKY